MAVKTARDRAQIQSDIAFLVPWLDQNYGTGVRTKIIKLIDKKLGLGGKIESAVTGFLQGKAIQAVLGNLNIASSVTNFSVGIWGWCFTEATLEQEPRMVTPYSPAENWNEYVTILILGWKRGDFRYMPLGKLYGK